MEWKERVHWKFAEGAGEGQLVAQAKERKKLDLLDPLKGDGGLFTDANQVQAYLERPGLRKEKQQRFVYSLLRFKGTSIAKVTLRP